MSSNFTSKHSAEGQAGSKPVNTRHISRREAIFATTQDETGGIKKSQLVELALSELDWYYEPVLVTDVFFFFSSLTLRFSLIDNFGFLRSSFPALSLVAIVASLLG